LQAENASLQSQIDALQSDEISMQSDIATLATADTQYDASLTALEEASSSLPIFYTVHGAQKTIPASSNSQFATVSCSTGDTAVSGSFNINGNIEGVNGIQITNSVQTADGNGWYQRINNAAPVAAQFTPAMLCVQYLQQSVS